jgi:hypothetical protein
MEKFLEENLETNLENKEKELLFNVFPYFELEDVFLETKKEGSIENLQMNFRLKLNFLLKGIHKTDSLKNLYLQYFLEYKEYILTALEEEFSNTVLEIFDEIEKKLIDLDILKQNSESYNPNKEFLQSFYTTVNKNNENEKKFSIIPSPDIDLSFLTKIDLNLTEISELEFYLLSDNFLENFMDEIKQKIIDTYFKKNAN